MTGGREGQRAETKGFTGEKENQGVIDFGLKKVKEERKKKDLATLLS